MKPIDILVEKHRIKVENKTFPSSFKEFGKVKETPELLIKVVVGVSFY
jgi:hypothetical protein